MVRREKDNRTAGDVQVQVIAGRDGKPAFVALPFEVFFTLLTYAREGGAATPDKVMRERLYDRLREDNRAFSARFIIGRKGSGKTAALRDYLGSMLSEGRMDETFEDVRRWLSSIDGSAAHHSDDNDDDEDVAAYDAAKARDEESFPFEIADRLIGGENPIKVFRQYRGLTQKQLAAKAETSAAYLSQIETGRRSGSIKMLHRVADALDVGLEDLV
jgi:DNA-binding XRE family transcriptional regulator